MLQSEAFIAKQILTHTDLPGAVQHYNSNVQTLFQKQTSVRFDLVIMSHDHEIHLQLHGSKSLGCHYRQQVSHQS